MNVVKSTPKSPIAKTTVYRTVWLLVTTAVVTLVAIATPLRYRMLQSDIYDYADGLAALGLSLDFFTAYFVSWELLLIAGSLMVAGLIAWRRADDWFAMLVALGLSLFGLLPPLIDGIHFVDPRWAIPISFLRLMIMGVLMALYCLYPNGRFQPGWTRWLLLTWLLFSTGALLARPLMMADAAVLPNTRSWQDAAWLLIGVAWFSVAIVGQIVRYRRYATLLEKQQMKWVLLGFVILVLFTMVSSLLLINNPTINRSPINEVRFTLVMGAGYLLLALALPASIAFAILRYRLWDVDILLNRTLVYGGLTAMITAVYALLVGGVGAMAASAQSQIAGIAVATVLVVVGIRPFYRCIDKKINQLLPVPKPIPQIETKTQPFLVKWLKVGWLINVLWLALLFIAGLVEQAKLHAFFNPIKITQFSEIAISRLMVGAVLDNNPSLVTGILLASYGQALAFTVVGLFIFWQKSHDVMGIVASWMFVAIGIGFTPTIVSLPLLAPAWHIPVTLFQISMFGSALLFLGLFPNGRFYPRWTKWAVIGWFAFMLLWLPFPQLNLHRSTSIWPAFIFAVIIMLELVAQLFRYHTIANPNQKQQTKWVIFGFIVANSGLIAIGMFTEFDLILSSPQKLLGFIFLALGPVFIPATVAVALLRYRLWQIDVIINRTLVYGGLSLGIVMVYGLVVGSLSTLFQSQGSVVSALFATGLIAVLFQPVRERLQRAANRLIFGERDDPYAVLSKLGQRLQKTAVPSQTLPAITATITQTLKLPYAAIVLQTAEGAHQTVAASGQWQTILHEWPLHYQGAKIGRLVVAPRSPNELFTDKEQQLLADIAAQSGAAAYSVRLTTALQRSREKLVLAREEERRRIRRDLHDELGPALASQTFTLDAALDLLESDPKKAVHLLQKIKTQNQELVADIRQLVYALRPPALDELGLVGALRVMIERLANEDGPAITLTVSDGELTALPAAVEVAAYRIALEGINNVIRHAQAQHCTVTLARENDRLTLTIEDDGRGLSSQATHGVGLTSMQERVAELGGQLTISACFPSGTRITAVLPSGDPFERMVQSTHGDLH